jgi:hypothetical protein
MPTGQNPISIFLMKIRCFFECPILWISSLVPKTNVCVLFNVVLTRWNIVLLHDRSIELLQVKNSRLQDRSTEILWCSIRTFYLKKVRAVGEICSTTKVQCFRKIFTYFYATKVCAWSKGSVNFAVCQICRCPRLYKCFSCS